MAGRMGTSAYVQVIPVTGLPEIVDGDDIGYLILKRCIEAGIEIVDGCIVVVAQKVVSKAEGAVRKISAQKPGQQALQLAEKVGKDPRLIQIILDELIRVIRAVSGVLIVETKQGFICANAGVDQSNIEGEDIVTVLPEDSDVSARKILETVSGGSGSPIGVIVSDTFNRPWREGATNVAIGIAGLDPLYDLRGTNDDFNRTMKTSIVALADELASAAQLVMGESGRIPAAIINGARWEQADHSISRAMRPADRDLFR